MGNINKSKPKDRQENLDERRKETLKKYAYLELLKNEDEKDNYYKLPHEKLHEKLHHTDLTETNYEVGEIPAENTEELIEKFNLNDFNRIFQENRHLLHVDPLIKHEGLPRKTY